MAIKPISIPPLQERNPIVDADRRPVVSFIRALNNAFRQISASFNNQAEIVEQLAILAGIVDDQGELISAQQDQIDGLQSQGTDLEREQSIVNSGIINVGTPPMISADDTGNIYLSDHERRYGNPAINPTVSVTGGSATEGLPGNRVYVYYDDPTRSGGAVTYQYSLDAADAIQGGDRHSVGSVEIPVTGTSDGTYVRPPGVT